MGYDAVSDSLRLAIVGALHFDAFRICCWLGHSSLASWPENPQVWASTGRPF